MPVTATVNGQRTAEGQSRWLRASRLPQQPVTTPPSVRRKPNRTLLVAGGVAALAAAVLGAKLAAGANKSIGVLVLTRPVAAGQQFTAADLSVARLSGSGVHAVAASALAQVVGETATATLPAGTLLTGSMMTRDSVPGPGQEVLAVALKAGAFPPALTAGESVSVLRTPSADGGSGVAPQVLVRSAEVLAVDADPASATMVVSLLLGQSDALSVAGAANAGQVSLAIVASGAGS